MERFNNVLGAGARPLSAARPPGAGGEVAGCAETSPIGAIRDFSTSSRIGIIANRAVADGPLEHRHGECFLSPIAPLAL